MNSPALHTDTEDLPGAGLTRCYAVYGLRIRTPIPLTMPELPRGSPYDIDVLEGNPSVFEESLKHLTLKPDWAQAHRLPGQWLYARIGGLFDFLVSPDGSQVFYRPLGKFSMLSFETYLLGLLMKAVLIKKGIHSLHASAVVVDGKAVAFLGSNGFGKSSLAACFVGAGYPLLTDDLLRVDEEGGRIWAYPGPASLKLLPDALRWLDGSCAGVPMDPMADKYLFPVNADLQCATRPALAAIYTLIGPDEARKTKEIAIEALNHREALVELLYGIYTDRVVEPDRAMNPFDTAKRIAGGAPVRRLFHPWVFASLSDVRDAVLSDVRGL